MSLQSLKIYPIISGQSSCIPKGFFDIVTEIRDQIFYKRRFFWWVCGGPTALAVFYFFVWATPRYQSVSILRVYEYGGGGSSAPQLLSVGGGSSGGALVKAIVNSWECFIKMDPKALATEWRKTDFFTRFGGVRTLFSHNEMWLWRYYRAHAYVKIDNYSGLVSIKVDGVDPRFVYQTSKNIILYLKDRLSTVGGDAYLRERKKMDGLLVADRNKLAHDLHAMEEFQKKYGIADYDTLYMTTLELITKVQEQRISLESRMNVAQAFAKRSQELDVVKVQLATIDKNLEQQKAFILKNMAPLYERFSYLAEKIKEDTLGIKMDNTSLQMIEQMAVGNSYHVDILQEPQIPTDPTLPYALLWTLCTFGVSWLLYLIMK